jgi:hypothetical protein
LINRFGADKVRARHQRHFAPRIDLSNAEGTGQQNGAYPVKLKAQMGARLLKGEFAQCSLLN